MNLRELARAVPIHIHDGRRYFVRIGEIHDPLQGKFVEALRAQCCQERGHWHSLGIGRHG